MRRKTFSISPLSNILVVVSSQIPFIRLGSFLLFLIYWEIFNWKGCWIFFKCVFFVYKDDYEDFLLGFVKMWITLIDFQMLKQFCLSKINSSCLWHLILSYIAGFVKILLRFFFSRKSRRCIYLFIYFLKISFPGFGTKVMQALGNKFGTIFFNFLSLYRTLCRIGIVSSLNVC